ncbi:MAG: phosphatase PAP2 family protein [Patescibacteria group bacterium]
MMDILSSFDANTVQALAAVRTPGTTQLFMSITALGSTVLIGGLSILLGLYFLVRGRLSLLAGLAVAIGGAGTVLFTLKEAVARARPPAALQAYAETGFSFPSGHATMSLAFYGFLAYLAYGIFPAGRYRVAATVAAGGLVWFIGFSRVYLGVHYPSDVGAGFVIAAIFLWLAVVVTKKFGKNAVTR